MHVNVWMGPCARVRVRARAHVHTHVDAPVQTKMCANIVTVENRVMLVVFYVRLTLLFSVATVLYIYLYIFVNVPGSNINHIVLCTEFQPKICFLHLFVC